MDEDKEKEKKFLEELVRARQSQNRDAVEHAVNNLALYYCFAVEEFEKAIPYWMEGARLLEEIGPDSRELATYLHSMAEWCLIPAQRRDEARQTLLRAKAIYQIHFTPIFKPLKELDQMLNDLNR